MSDRRLTDAQIATALRSHLPAEARPGLLHALQDAVEVTPQQRALPSVAGWLSDADPSGRQRSLLLLIALVLAATLLGLAAATGAQRLFEQKTPELDLTDPAGVATLVASTYNRMPLMPPVAITTLADGSPWERIYVDRSGAVRFEDATPGATGPRAYRILNGTTMGELVIADGRPTWVVQAGAISEDPRVFLLAELEGGGVQPGCDATGATDITGPNPTTPVGWSYLGTEDVAGRQAYHVTCSGGDLWIDAATRLILRSQGPGRTDAALGPNAGTAQTIEVTRLDFGDQPADLFRIAAPAGVPSMSVDAYQCQLASAACPTTPPPTPLDTLPVGAVTGPLGSLAPLRVGNGWIAYSTDGPSPGATDVTTGSDIYLVRDGGTPTLIAGRDRGATRNACPSFSPDGMKLAYASNSGPAIVVAGVNAAGATGESIRITLPGGGWPICVRWSTDGKRLAFLEGAREVVLGLDGSTLAPAPGDPSVADLAAPPDGNVRLLSPSGEWAARIRGDGGGCQLVVSKPDNTDIHVIGLGYCPYAVAAWSPDGTRILLMEDVSGTDFTMHAVAIDSGVDAVVVSTVRTNGARSWPGYGDVSWQPVLP